MFGALALAVSACGGGDGAADDADGNGTPVNIASGPLTGKVGGAPWTIVAAQTDAFLSDDQTIWVDAYAMGPITCGGFGDGNSLILNVPRQVGTHPLSLSLNATFVVQGAETDNLIATQGSIRVDEVTTSIVRGGIAMTFNADNQVSGEFQAVVCAE